MSENIDDKLKEWMNGVCDVQPDISVLQPADPFIESAGEDMQQRIFLAQNNQSNSELRCFRPEFTIPICLYHMENNNNATRYGYDGTVFRQTRENNEEFRQVGLEDIGDENTSETDANAIKDMMEALKIAGSGEYNLIVGDKNLFSAIVDSLKIPERLAARIQRNFGEDKLLNKQIENLCEAPNALDVDENIINILNDEKKLKIYVAEKFEGAGLSPRTGRTPDDIVNRLRDKVKDAEFKLPESGAELIRKFLKLRMPLSEAPEALGKLSEEEKIDFGDALKLFCERIKKLEEKNVDLDKCVFQSAFGRKIDYYTGVLFEARNDVGALAGGGRYDKLCNWLNMTKNAELTIPAIGFSLAMDRIEDRIEKSGERL